MARKYSVYGQAAAGASKTILTLISVSTTRGWAYEFGIGVDATPADLAQEWVVLRFTAAGTAGSSPTGRALDPGNPGALITAGAGVFSVEPTYTANSELWGLGINQRASYRWIAAPGGEMVIPVTAANGLGIRSIEATHTANTNCYWMWEE